MRAPRSEETIPVPAVVDASTSVAASRVTPHPSTPYGRLTREMTRFAERKFEKQIYYAWQDFNLSEIPEPLEQSSDELQVFMPYFLFQWDPDRPSRSKRAHRRGGVVARWYRLEKSKQLTAME